MLLPLFVKMMEIEHSKMRKRVKVPANYPNSDLSTKRRALEISTSPKTALGNLNLMFTTNLNSARRNYSLYEQLLSI